MANSSEKLLKNFLKFKKRGNFKILLSLRGQGDNTFISEAPINLCTVTIGENDYLFGGISESFYDKMVEKYHGKTAKDIALEQIKLQHELQNLGYNIVTCGNCGSVLIHRTNVTEIECYCGTHDISDCPDLNYQGMENNQEFN
jgi:hypothetical protein